jgi:hypothetical protein
MSNRLIEFKIRNLVWFWDDAFFPPGEIKVVLAQEATRSLGAKCFAELDVTSHNPLNWRCISLIKVPMQEKLNLQENYMLQEFSDFLSKSSLMDLSCSNNPLVLCCVISDGGFQDISIDIRREKLFYIYGNVTVSMINCLSVFWSADVIVFEISSRPIKLKPLN